MKITPRNRRLVIGASIAGILAVGAIVLAVVFPQFTGELRQRAGYPCQGVCMSSCVAGYVQASGDCISSGKVCCRPVLATPTPVPVISCSSGLSCSQTPPKGFSSQCTGSTGAPLFCCSSNQIITNGQCTPKPTPIPYCSPRQTQVCLSSGTICLKDANGGHCSSKIRTGD